MPGSPTKKKKRPHAWGSETPTIRDAGERQVLIKLILPGVCRASLDYPLKDDSFMVRGGLGGSLRRV